MGGQTLERPTLSTARLWLRPLEPDDAPQLARLANNYDVAKMTGSFPHPYALIDAQALITKARACNPAREAWFAITVPGEGPIGTMAFMAGDGPWPEAGYWIGEPHWGKGYASEMLKGAMNWVRHDWGKRCVVAGHFADNDASGVVLCKAGFLYTGVVEMHHSKARGHEAPSRQMVWLA